METTASSSSGRNPTHTRFPVNDVGPGHSAVKQAGSGEVTSDEPGGESHRQTRESIASV